jgi:hypothetical protein
LDASLLEELPDEFAPFGAVVVEGDERAIM